jgi:inner membrane protein
VDSLTHGLLAFYLLSVAGLGGDFLVPVVIGAMFPDLDILFQRLSDRYPRYFIFTHGGFTHSFCGTLAIAAMLTGITSVLSITGLPVPPIGFTLFVAFLAGSLDHVGLDILAFPGIPIFYPFSSQKHTLGIFPGPSLLIFGVTVLFLALVVLGIQSLMSPFLYLAIVIGFIGFRALLKAAMIIIQKGIAIPRLNPFHWFIVREHDEVYVLESYHMTGKQEILGEFPRYQNITKEELAPYLDRPEVRRHRYYSYLSVAVRTDDTVLMFDPLRREKFIWYPPDYVSIEISLKKQS